MTLLGRCRLSRRWQAEESVAPNDGIWEHSGQERQIRSLDVVVRGVKTDSEMRSTASAATRQRLVALYEANVDDVYRYCLARSGDPQIADDATSEAFLAAARSMKSQDGLQIDRAWLFVVAKRRIIDLWRIEQRHSQRVARLQHETTRASASDFGAETSGRVLNALQSLPTRQRAALTLRYLDECSVSEVAETLGCAYTAAESLLARGRRGFTNAWHEQRSV